MKYAILFNKYNDSIDNVWFWMIQKKIYVFPMPLLNVILWWTFELHNKLCYEFLWFILTLAIFKPMVLLKGSENWCLINTSSKFFYTIWHDRWLLCLTKIEFIALLQYWCTNWTKVRSMKHKLNVYCIWLRK